MVWGKAGSTTLTSAGATISVSGFTASKFNIIPSSRISSGTASTRFRSGGNSTNYAWRQSYNGGTDSTTASTTSGKLLNIATGVHGFCIIYGVNIDGEEKLFIVNEMSGYATGAGNTPERAEIVAKQTATAQYTQFDVIEDGSGDLASDSNLSVLGSDLTPAAAVPAVPAQDNVQDNSIFVETDTARRYWFDTSSPLTGAENTTGGSGVTVMTEGGNEAHYGIAVKSGSALIGKSISQATFSLRMNENPSSSNLVYCRLWHDGAWTHVFGSTAPTNIATSGSSFTSYSFGTGGNFDGGNGSSPILVAGDRIVMSWDRQYGSGYYGQYLVVEYKSTDGYDGQNTCATVASNGASAPSSEGTWSTSSSLLDRDPKFSLVGESPATWTMQPTYEDNFSSDNWTDWGSGTPISVDTTSGKLNFEVIGNDQSNDIGTQYDLTSVSDTAFVLDFDYSITEIDFRSSGWATYIYIGLSSLDNDGTNEDQNAQDYVGMYTQISNDNDGQKAIAVDNASIPDADGDVFDLAEGDTWYMRYVRDGNSMTITWYSDSARTTVQATKTLDVTNISGLRYFVVRNHSVATYTPNGKLVGSIDNVTFYNGVTSP